MHTKVVIERWRLGIVKKSLKKSLKKLASEKNGKGRAQEVGASQPKGVIFNGQ